MELGASGGDDDGIIDFHVYHDAGFRRGAGAGAGAAIERRRENEELIAHQNALGVARTVLLDANAATLEFARHDPWRWVCFTSAPLDDPAAFSVMARNLEAGAAGIGGVRSAFGCDSPAMQRVAELARDYRVPVLLDFWDDVKDDSFFRFQRMLERYPSVNFIGPAAAGWTHLDCSSSVSDGTRATGVSAGGQMDRWLADYPNLFADLSSRSGTDALTRHPELGRDFVTRHQDRLLFGSDCCCRAGATAGCLAQAKLQAIARLDLGPAITAKVLAGNARRLLNRSIPPRPARPVRGGVGLAPQ